MFEKGTGILQEVCVIKMLESLIKIVLFDVTNDVHTQISAFCTSYSFSL